MRKFTLKMMVFVMALFMSQGIMAQDNILFEEHFDEENLGSFTVEGSNGNEETPVWRWDAEFNTVIADAFGRIPDAKFESYLVSPVIKLGDQNIVTFDHATQFFANINDIALCVREEGTDTWTKISEDLPDVEELTNVGDITIPAELAGKSVQIGFMYTAADAYAGGFWVLDNIIVKSSAATKKKDPKIFYEYDEVEAILGQAFKAPALINPNGVEIVYSSDNEEVATVDAKTGVVTIVKEGNAKIVATSVENEEFISASTSFLLTVKQGGSSDYILEEYFESSLGGFTVEGYNGENSNIWYVDAGCARADAYGKIDGENTNYLVSPEITLAESNNVAEFTYYFSNYGTVSAQEQLGFCVREIGGEWEQLEIPECMDTNEIISSGDIIIPAAYNGKNVQVAFKYYCESNGFAGVIGIDQIIIQGETSAGIENISADDVNNGKIYDLQGRVVTNPTRGIYIINGKKFVIK